MWPAARASAARACCQGLLPGAMGRHSRQPCPAAREASASRWLCSGQPRWPAPPCPALAPAAHCPPPPLLQGSDADSPRSADLVVERSSASMSLRSGASVRAALGVGDWAAERGSLLRQLNSPSASFSAGGGPGDLELPHSPPSATSRLALGADRLASITDRLASFNEPGASRMASMTEGGPKRSGLSVTSKAGDALVQRSGRSASQAMPGSGPERSSASASIRSTAAALAAIRAEYGGGGGGGGAGGGSGRAEALMQQARASARMAEMSPRLAAIQNSLAGGGSRGQRAAQEPQHDSPPPSSRRGGGGAEEPDSGGRSSADSDRSGASGASLGAASLKSRAQALLQARGGGGISWRQLPDQLLSSGSGVDDLPSAGSVDGGGQEAAGSDAGSETPRTPRAAAPRPTSKADPAPRRILNILSSYAAIGERAPAMTACLVCPPAFSACLLRPAPAPPHAPAAPAAPRPQAWRTSTPPATAWCSARTRTCAACATCAPRAPTRGAAATTP
jgi:hypothetical protein